MSGKVSRQSRADDTAYEGRAGSKSMHEVRILEVGCTEEESLKSLLCAGDDRGVISEKQAAEYGNHHNTNEIAATTSFVVIDFIHI